MPNANTKAAASICRIVLIQVKQQYMGLLGPALLAPAPPSKHMPEGAMCERLHMATAPEEQDSSPGPCLAARLPAGRPCPVLLLPLTCTTASPGKKSKREPRAVGFTSYLQGLTTWNPNSWSHTFLCYPRHAAGCVALHCATLSMSEGKKSSAELNKTRPGNVTLVFNPSTTLILIETTI